MTLRWDLASGEIAHEVAQTHGDNDSDFGPYPKRPTGKLHLPEPGYTVTSHGSIALL